MQLKSQEMRKLAPELDPLRIGTGWKKEDLGKVQVMVESTYGDSHPGSGHLNILVEEVRKGIAEEGGYGARYYCTDICDGESQGTDGINYSLASREMIANMIEIHANATPFDAGVYLSSCDKGVPGNLMGLARVNIPSVFVPGGTMNAGPEMLTLEQLGMYSAKYERGEIDEAKLDWAKCNACPSCGACSFIGTASTMQIMAEALGLALPGSALMPATSPDLLAYAREAGRQAVKLAQMEHMRPPEFPIFSTTLCYLERDDAYLMLHRIKKQDDYNHDKWIGVGGKFERFESPEDCLLREVKEETGLTLKRFRARGLLTFIWGNMTEFIHLYTADEWTGEMVQGDACREGVLEWVPKDKAAELPIWEGDKIFFRLLNEERPYFSLKLVYEGDTLTQAVLDGKRIV